MPTLEQIQNKYPNLIFSYRSSETDDGDYLVIENDKSLIKTTSTYDEMDIETFDKEVLQPALVLLEMSAKVE